MVIFNEGLGKIAERFLEKGAKVYLEGKLTTRKWQDQSGADRYSTEIHLTPYNGVLTFLDSRRDGAGAVRWRAGRIDQLQQRSRQRDPVLNHHRGERAASALGAAVFLSSYPTTLDRAFYTR